MKQDWLQQNTPDFIKKEKRPPNSPDLNPLDYHIWGVMLEKCQAFMLKPQNKMKTVSSMIWADLPQ